MGNTRILRYIDLGNKMVDFVLVIFIDTPWEIWEMGNVGNMGSGKCPIHSTGTGTPVYGYTKVLYLLIDSRNTGYFCVSVRRYGI